MTTIIKTLPWEHPDWLAHASAWIHAHLAAHGLDSDNPIEVIHQRIWSTFLQIETAEGTVYFKAPSPTYAFEAPLTQALAQWHPQNTVPLLAVDNERGWILSRDAGVTIRSLEDTDTQLQHMAQLLPAYAQFQMEIAPRVHDLLGLGVIDRRLASIPRLYDALLQDGESLRVELTDGLTTAEYERAQALRPALAEWCEQLASLGLPETLTHEELTTSNVLVSREGGYIYTDWSDCSVAHPFFTMVVTIRATAHWLKLEETSPEMARLRDAYLEPWTTFAPRAQLDEGYALALRLGMLNRSLSWQATLKTLSPEEKEAYYDYVPGWLQDFLNA